MRILKGDQRDIDMIMSPAKWPGAVLCVKRYTKHGPKCGCIKPEDYGFEVFEHPKSSDVIIASYSTAKEMVDDGWMVD